MPRKHRRLSSKSYAEDTGDPAFHNLRRYRDRRELQMEGQGIYFIGGLPLIYWSDGDQMGMKFDEGVPCIDDGARYQLTDGLLAFGEYGGAHSKHIDIWTYTKYLQRQEQAMIDGKYIFT